MTAIHDAARALVYAVADGDRAAIIDVLGHEPFTNTGAPAGTADFLAALAVVLAEAALADEQVLAKVMTAPAAVDDVAIERRLAGEPVYLNGDEVVAAVRRGHAKGMNTTTIAKRLNISGERVIQLAKSYGRVS